MDGFANPGYYTTTFQNPGVTKSDHPILFNSKSIRSACSHKNRIWLVGMQGDQMDINASTT